MNKALLAWAPLALGCAKLLGFQPGHLEETGSGVGGVMMASGGDGADPGSSGGGLMEAAGAPPQAGTASDLCGNDHVDEGEDCDATILDGMNCALTAAAAGGDLSCSDACKYDLTGCYFVQSVAIGRHGCAVLSNGKLKCWGGNGRGQLGLGDLYSRGEEGGEMGASLPFVELGTQRVLQVTVGTEHTCVLTSEHRVHCWGDNFSGQLGLADVELLSSPSEMPVDLGPGTVKHVAAGAWHTCALFDTGKLKCWGDNNYGQLGLEDNRSRGKLQGELGEQLPFVETGIAVVEQLSVGETHTCALGASDVKCWGLISYGHFDQDGNQQLVGDAPSEMGTHLPVVDLGWQSTLGLISGGQHNCAMGSEGTLKCWGDNSFGQLGSGDTEPRLSFEQFAGQLRAVDLGAATIHAVAAGRWHNCALVGEKVGEKELKCWGANDLGQLGLGDTESRGYVAGQMGRALPVVNIGTNLAIVSVHAGESSTCVIVDQGRLKCWGQNDRGALGLGKRYALLGGFPGEMGDALPFVEL